MVHRVLKLVDSILIEFKGQEISKGNIGVFNFPRKQFQNIFLVSALVDLFLLIPPLIRDQVRSYRGVNCSPESETLFHYKSIIKKVISTPYSLLRAGGSCIYIFFFGGVGGCNMVPLSYLAKKNQNLNMDYVRHVKIQGRSLVFFKTHCPCILPCLTQSMTRTTDTQTELFFKNSKLLGLGRQFGPKFYEAFGVFLAKL